MTSSTPIALFDLEAKVAVITGGNGGIGLGCARGLAKAGATIVIWARDTKKNAAAKSELEALGATATIEHGFVVACFHKLFRLNGLDTASQGEGDGAHEDEN